MLTFGGQMKILVVSALFCLVLLGGAGLAAADSIYGDCQWKDGSKCGGAVRISTSWNSKKAYPKNGRYTLQFDGKVRKTITVYCNGSTVGTVYVSGSTRLDIVCR